MADGAGAAAPAPPLEVGRVRVRVLGVDRLPRTPENLRPAKCAHPPLFFVTAAADHRDAVWLRTPRAPASWGADAARPQLGQVAWGSGSVTGDGDALEAEFPFFEVSSDLVLQLRRAEAGKADSCLLGELCLPLSVLPLAPDGAPLSAAPLHAHWHELLLPRPAHGQHTQQARPREGTPGRLSVAALVQLADRDAAYLRAPYTPHPARNLWPATRNERKHPDIGVLAVGGVHVSFFRLLNAASTLAAGCLLAPLRTVCYLQTWRSPELNVAVTLAMYAATTEAAWRYSLILSPLYTWASIYLNGHVMCRLHALEQPAAWCEPARAGGGLVAAVLGGTANFVRAVPGFARDAPEVVKEVQWWLVMLAERVEALDNALSWVDPHATHVLMHSVLYQLAAALSAVLLLLSVLPMRSMVRASVLLVLLPLPAHTLQLLRRAQRTFNLDEAYASGLVYITEAVASHPSDMDGPDWLLAMFLKLLRKAARGWRREAAAAAPRPPPAAPRVNAAWEFLKRLPDKSRALHMQLNTRTLLRLQVKVPPAFVRTRLVVKYNPVLAHKGHLMLSIKLFADDTDAADGAAALPPPPPKLAPADSVRDGAEVMLEFIVFLREGDKPRLRLEPTRSASERYPWLGSCGNTKELWEMPSLELACSLPQPMHNITLMLTPNWRKWSAADGSLLAGVDGKLAALTLCLLRRRRLRPARCTMLGIVPVQFAARALGQNPEWLRPLPRGSFLYDVVLSFRETETGQNADDFAGRLHRELSSRVLSDGSRVRSFCYAELADAGQEELSTLFHGVRNCRLFVPICSPTYAHTRLAPGSANELYAAWRFQQRRGTPAILPLWHSGVYPPPGAAPVLQHAPQLRMPRGKDAGGTSVADLKEPVLDTAENVMAALAELIKGPTASLLQQFAIPAAVRT